MGMSRARARVLCCSVVLSLMIPATGEADGGIGARSRAPRSPARQGPYLLLDLAFFDNVGLSDRMKGFLFREVERGFHALGVAVGWVDRVREPRRPVRTHEVRVLVVNVSPVDWGFGPGVLGMVRGRRPGTVYVFYPAVVRNLRRYRPFRLPESGVTELGKESPRVARALARVMVHELVHTLTPDLGHADEGIMQRNLDTYDLGSRPLRLDPVFQAALHRNLLEAIAEARGVPVEELVAGQGPGK